MRVDRLVRTTVAAAFLAVFGAMGGAAASPISTTDIIVIHGIVYGDSQAAIMDGQGPVFVGGLAMYGGTGWGVLNIFLVEPETGLIGDHIFSGSGSSTDCTPSGYGADCVFVTADSSDASIGTACTMGPDYCVMETGGYQDLSAMVTAQNGGQGIFAGSLGVITDAIPEPGVLAIFGAGLLGLGFVRRRARQRS